MTAAGPLVELGQQVGTLPARQSRAAGGRFGRVLVQPFGNARLGLACGVLCVRELGARALVQSDHRGQFVQVGLRRIEALGAQDGRVAALEQGFEQAGAPETSADQGHDERLLLQLLRGRVGGGIQPLDVVAKHRHQRVAHGLAGLPQLIQHGHDRHADDAGRPSEAGPRARRATLPDQCWALLAGRAPRWRGPVGRDQVAQDRGQQAVCIGSVRLARRVVDRQDAPFE